MDENHEEKPDSPYWLTWSNYSMRLSSVHRQPHHPRRAEQPTNQSSDAPSICTKHFRRGECEFDHDPDNSNHVGRHCDTPFQWQVEKASDWQDLTKSENEAAEKAFCDVNSSADFAGSGHHSVRRLSTASSVQKTNWEQAFCIEWLWYWRDESNIWIDYSEKNKFGKRADVSSTIIEQKYLDYESKQGACTFHFTADGQSYKLDFKTMEQTNVRYGTRKAVRRRPKFVPLEERMRISQSLLRRVLSLDLHEEVDLGKEENLGEEEDLHTEMDPIENLFGRLHARRKPSLNIDDIWTAPRQDTSSVHRHPHHPRRAEQPTNQSSDAPSNCTKHFRRGEFEFDHDPDNSNHFGRHCDTTFQWHVGKSSCWQDLTKSENEAAEKAFCDVNRSADFAGRHTSQTMAKSLDVPTTWDNSGSQTDMKLVTISDRSSEEYNTVARSFKSTMDDQADINLIQRVQNQDLWEDFLRQKERMRKKNGGRDVLQKQLFHGTQWRNIDAICRQNLDWRLSGTNVGAAYGKGSYLARDASFAHDYTTPDSDGYHYVFVAQVLVGDYTNGQRSFVRPPSKDGNPHGELYDSCVDNKNDPTIHVVFEKMQTYPEYLIKYKPKQSDSSCAIL